MSERNYTVHGRITFFVNDKIHTTRLFKTHFLRRRIINEFLKAVHKIKRTVVVYWIIEVDENTIEPILNGGSEVPPLDLKETYFTVKDNPNPIFRTHLHRVCTT